VRTDQQEDILNLSTRKIPLGNHLVCVYLKPQPCKLCFPFITKPICFMFIYG